MYNTRTYLPAWGDCIINHTYKNGDVNDAQNYRGITLINKHVLAKSDSQLLLNGQINMKLTNNQFGVSERQIDYGLCLILH